MNTQQITMDGTTYIAWQDEAKRWGVDPTPYTNWVDLRKAVLDIARGSLIPATTTSKNAGEES